MAKSNLKKENGLLNRDTTDIDDSVVKAIGDTPLVRLSRLFPDYNILAKLDYMNPGGSMKDRIGIRMIEQAESEGRIKPGDTLVEPTSGNTGIGIAMAAAVKGYKMIVTMPLKMSEEKRRLLKSYGAELILTPTELAFDHPDNYIEVAKRLARENEHIHLLNQYVNEGNPLAHYEGTGPEIWAQSGGDVDYFVSGMGTGGTISGVAKYLKEQKPDVQIVGIDPEGSIYTGEEPHPYLVEGIGYDFYPDVFDVAIVDHMVRVSDQESFSAARKLAKVEGILAGGSTGSVVAGLQKFLQEHKEAADKTIVMMVHDNGRNYLSTFYNDDWMTERGFSIEDDE